MMQGGPRYVGMGCTCQKKWQGDLAETAAMLPQRVTVRNGATRLGGQTGARASHRPVLLGNVLELGRVGETRCTSRVGLCAMGRGTRGCVERREWLGDRERRVGLGSEDGGGREMRGGKEEVDLRVW